MNPETPQVPREHFSLLRNWLSMIGLVIVLGSLFAFLLLIVLDAVAHFTNPYIGILTWIVAPGFLVLGLALTVLGAYLQRRWRTRVTGEPIHIRVDLSRPRDRKILGYFLVGSTCFLLMTAIGSYYTFHFTESVQFCGQLCHTVMQPEWVTYQHSPHARVACTACHIGPGATWFVRSKLSGSYQVYSVIFKKYPRPIPTPVQNLRPAQETCEQCHWPREFVGNMDRTYFSYLSDQTNPVYAVRMLLKVGGADPSRGPVGGIHWHMSVANRVEYVVSDASRQKIPWVRLIDPQGVVTEYRVPSFTNDISKYEIRRMDCIDCHNRPSHRYATPNDAVNLAMSLDRIDPALPWIKSNAVASLVQPYTNTAQALDAIQASLTSKYPGAPRIQQAVASVQQIYTNNFFPSMNAKWKDYPNNIGHKEWPGCTRCHDDQHTTADKRKTIKFSDCHQCHLILTQGSGKDLEQLNAQGVTFNHPGGDIQGMACPDCHDGTL